MPNLTELLDAAEIKAAPRKRRKRLGGCHPCKKKTLARMKAMEHPCIGAVIASLSEGAELEWTARSLHADSPSIRILAVDDASPIPEPVSPLYATIRNSTRLGVQRSRAMGALSMLDDPNIKVVGFKDGHMRFKAEDCAAEWNKHFPRTTPTARMLDGWGVRDKMGVLAELCVENDAIVYAGCNGHRTVRLMDEGPLLRCKWGRYSGGGVVPTSGLMGACYVLPRSFLEKVGGWPQLPGLWGFDEEAIALLACALGYPVLCHNDIQTWHLYRGNGAGVAVPYKTPSSRYIINALATLRLVFDDKEWENRKEMMRNGFTIHPDRILGYPEALITEIESERFMPYVRAVQAEFVLDTTGILAELARRRAADPTE